MIVHQTEVLYLISFSLYSKRCQFNLIAASTIFISSICLRYSGIDISLWKVPFEDLLEGSLTDASALAKATDAAAIKRTRVQTAIAAQAAATAPALAATQPSPEEVAAAAAAEAAAAASSKTSEGKRGRRLWRSSKNKEDSGAKGSEPEAVPLPPMPYEPPLPGAAGTPDGAWYLVKPWDPLTWADGKLTRSELRDAEQQERAATRQARSRGDLITVGFGLGEVNVAHASVTFLSPQATPAGSEERAQQSSSRESRRPTTGASAATSAAAPETKTTTGSPRRPPVVRRLRLELLGVEVHDVGGLRAEATKAADAKAKSGWGRANRAKGLPDPKPDPRQVHAALRRTLLAHTENTTPSTAATAGGKSGTTAGTAAASTNVSSSSSAVASEAGAVGCVVRWRGSAVNAGSLPHWWGADALHDQRLPGQAPARPSAYTLALPLEDNDISQGDSSASAAPGTVPAAAAAAAVSATAADSTSGESPELELEVTSGGKAVGMVKLDWKETLRHVVPTYRTAATLNEDDDEDSDASDESKALKEEEMLHALGTSLGAHEDDHHHDEMEAQFRRATKKAEARVHRKAEGLVGLGGPVTSQDMSLRYSFLGADGLRSNDDEDEDDNFLEDSSDEDDDGWNAFKEDPAEKTSSIPKRFTCALLAAAPEVNKDLLPGGSSAAAAGANLADGDATAKDSNGGGGGKATKKARGGGWFGKKSKTAAEAEAEAKADLAEEAAIAAAEAAPLPGTEHVRVEVLRARKLPAADRGGTSDPYAVAELVHLKSGKPVTRPQRYKFTTETVKKTLSPVWESEEGAQQEDKSKAKRSAFASLSFCDAKTWHTHWSSVEGTSDLGVRVTVYDQDMVTSEPLGSTTLPLSMPSAKHHGGTGAIWVALDTVTKAARGGALLAVPPTNETASDGGVAPPVKKKSKSGVPQGSAGSIKLRLTVIGSPPPEPGVACYRVLPHVRLHFRLIVEECRPLSKAEAAQKEAEEEAQRLQLTSPQPPSQVATKSKAKVSNATAGSGAGAAVAAAPSDASRAGVSDPTATRQLAPRTVPLGNTPPSGQIARIRFMLHSALKLASVPSSVLAPHSRGIEGGGGAAGTTTAVATKDDQHSEDEDPWVTVTAEWCGEPVDVGDQEVTSGHDQPPLRGFSFHNSPPPPPPGLLAYMQRLFESADEDDSGELDIEELENLLHELDLGLTDGDVEAIAAVVDTDGSGTVKWSEFVAFGERLIRTIFAKKDWAGMRRSPWVKLKDPSGGSFYFNRATMDTEWCDPEGDPEQAKRMRRPPLPRFLALGPPTLLRHFEQLFEAADWDKSGELEPPAFWAAVRGMGLELSARDQAAWIKAVDADGSGTLGWAEFSRVGEALLTKAFLKQRAPDRQHHHNNADAWMNFTDVEGHGYEMNLVTGESAWDEAEEYAWEDPGDDDDDDDDGKKPFRPPAPSLSGQLKTLFEKHDVDGSGSLDLDEFVALIYELNLGLSNDELAKVKELVDTDGSGTVSWNEFARVGLKLLKDVLEEHDFSSESDGESVWQVNHTDEGHEYYFNRATGESVWAADASDELLATVLGPEPTDNLMLNHLKQLFDKHDSDGSGELDWPEFWHLWSELNLGLTDEGIAAWQTCLDADGSGTVTWEEFEAVGVEMLQEALHNSPSGSDQDPWMEFIDDAGNPYRVGCQFVS